MKNTEQIEAMRKLIKQAKDDPHFFHDLYWNTEKALNSIDYITPQQKAALQEYKPEDLLIGIAATVNIVPESGECDAGATACPSDTTCTRKLEDFQEVINPVDPTLAKELSHQLTQIIVHNFSRFRR